jgi:hypothetical protein
MQGLTHSRIQSYNTCNRKHLFEYELAIRPERTAAPLRMGSAVHECCDGGKMFTQHCYGELPGAAIVERTLQHYDAKPADANYVQQWEVERAKIAAMMYGYYWRWPAWENVIATEQSFTAPIINPKTGRQSRTFCLRGKMDGIIRLNDGRIALLEHKTTSDDLDSDSQLWRRLRIDAQISIYYMAALDMGYKVETIIYDMLRKPQYRMSLATPLEKRKYKKDGTLYANLRDEDETPEAYYQKCMSGITEDPAKYYIRKEVPRTADDLAEAKDDLWGHTQRIKQSQNTGHWPRNTGACLQFGRCPYFDCCTGGYDINSGIVPDGFERVDNVHQELQESNDG